MQSKTEAAEFFKSGDLQQAINRYSLSLQQSPESETKHRAILNFNLGMCIIKLPQETIPVSEDSKPFATLTKEMSINNRKALEHFTASIELDPSYLKPVY